mgnify:CR=1 FL=1
MAIATIKLEFMPGSQLETAFKEAIRIASILDVWCEFSFNGVNCISNGKGDIEKGIKEYNEVLKLKRMSNKSAFS